MIWHSSPRGSPGQTHLPSKSNYIWFLDNCFRRSHVFNHLAICEDANGCPEDHICVRPIFAPQFEWFRTDFDLQKYAYNSALSPGLKKSSVSLRVVATLESLLDPENYIASPNFLPGSYRFLRTFILKGI